MHRLSRSVALVSFSSLVAIALCAADSERAPLARAEDSAGKDAPTIETVAGTGEPEANGDSGPAAEVAIGQPFGVEVGPDGALYICEVENHRVLRLDRKAQRVRVVAGRGEPGSSGDGGPATEARLHEPYEVRFDAEGDMFVVEMRGARIRRIDAESGEIATIAGTGEVGFGGDGGPATEAKLRQPHSIALDGRGGLYVADIGNHRIRRVDLETGVITTIAGTGEKTRPVDGTIAKGRPMLGPRALHIVDDTLWIALREGHSVWRMDLRSGRLAHVAGDGQKGFRDGAGSAARFDGPKGIVATADGREVFVVDTENHAIRRVDPDSGEVSTVAGTGPDGRGFGGDGGPALEALMDRPHGITVDEERVLYIGDSNNHRVRRVALGPR